MEVEWKTKYYNPITTLKKRKKKKKNMNIARPFQNIFDKWENHNDRMEQKKK